MVVVNRVVVMVAMVVKVVVAAKVSRIFWRTSGHRLVQTYPAVGIMLLP